MNDERTKLKKIDKKRKNKVEDTDNDDGYEPTVYEHTWLDAGLLMNIREQATAGAEAAERHRGALIRARWNLEERKSGGWKRTEIGTAPRRRRL